MDLASHVEADCKWSMAIEQSGAINPSNHPTSSMNSSHGQKVQQVNSPSCLATCIPVHGGYMFPEDDPLLKKGNSILDGKYFVVVERDDKKIKVACQTCPNKKTLSARIDALSNLVTHMKRMHPNELEEMQSYRSTKSQNRKSLTRSGHDGVESSGLSPSRVHALAAIPDDKAFTLTSTSASALFTNDESNNVSTSSNVVHKTEPIKYIVPQSSRVSQKDADAAVATYIVQGFHPLSTVEQPEFRNLVTTLNPSVVVLSRRSVSRHIEIGYSSMVSSIKKELYQQRYVCSSADICHAGHGTYLAVALHWIEPSSYERRSAAIACHRINQKDQRVGRVIDDVLTMYGVQNGNLVAKLTNNITSCADAYREFGIAVTSGNKTFRGDDEDDDTEDGEGNSSGIASCNVGSVDYQMTLPQHTNCVSHLLDQVFILDARHALQNKDFAVVNARIFAKCSALWKLAHKPRSARIIRDKLRTPLKTPCTSKWTSLYDSIYMLLEHKDIINEVFKELELPELEEIDFVFLSEFIEILRPIAISLKRLEDERRWYFGELIPTLFVTDNKIDLLQQNIFRYCYSFYHSISYGFKSRFSQYLNLQDVNDAILATVSHPYFKSRWLQSKPIFNTEAMRKHLHTMLLEAIMQSGEYFCINSHNTFAAETSHEDDFYEFEFKSRPLTSSMAVSRDLEMQVYSYFQETDTRLSLLDNYPAVKEVFLHYNTTLLSSAAVVQLLESGGLLQTRKKARLSDGLFEKLMLMKGNQYQFE